MPENFNGYDHYKTTPPGMNEERCDKCECWPEEMDKFCWRRGGCECHPDRAYLPYVGMPIPWMPQD